MDEKAPRAPRVPEDEDGSSIPASARGHDTLEAHARTREFIQPLDYFHILGERTQTTSPPPVGLEKGMGPSTYSHPGTPAASTTSDLSRSSTINSSQTQDSDITRYSQNTSSSDDTISVPRSLSFPVMGGSPLNRNFLPKGPDIPSGFSSLFDAYATIRAPRDWITPALTSTHLLWPEAQDETTLTHSKQALPSRHSTFPLERSRSQTKLEETHSFMPEGNGEPPNPDASSMSSQIPEAVATTVPDVHQNTTGQKMPPDEWNILQPDLLRRENFLPTHDVVDGSLDHKQAGLYCGFASESLVHYGRRSSRYRQHVLRDYKRTERTDDFSIVNFGTDREQACGRNGDSLCAGVGHVKLEAAATPESLRTFEHQNLKETDSMLESQSPSSSPGIGSSREESREPCLPDSDDNTEFPDGASTPKNEDDEDVAYWKLQESITSLVFESSCVRNVEERGVPVELYVHSLLERILTHRKPSAKGQALCLPIRSLPKHINEVPIGPGGADMHPPGAGSQATHGGGSGDTNKRVRDHEDDESPDFGSEEDHDNYHKQAKKQKTGKTDFNYSCPFRKRNPTRFNVRDHPSCALHSFQDFALLKRHIQSQHKKADGLFSCIRCKSTFEDQAALHDHLLELQGCQVRESTGNGDPEDGITAEVIAALQARTRNANIRKWRPLWKRLFPNDNAADIPDHEHEPPVELDEVQKHYYEEDSVREFVQSQPISQILTEHPFRYIVEGFRQCRGTPPDKHPKSRQDQDYQFLLTVRNALEMRTRSILESQQPQLAPIFATNQWAPELNDDFPFDLGVDIYSNQPYPSDPAYRTHSQYGHDGVSHIPAPSTLHSSEGTARPAPPQQPTNFPFATMQNGRLSLAAEGSGHRSSRLSSQRSRDSGDLRTLQTEETGETQNTQYTPISQDPQFSQDQSAILHNQQYHPHADDGRSIDHGGTCICSKSPSGIPVGGQHYCNPAVSGQGPSELNLCGIGEGTTGAFTPNNRLYISNSDEEFSPSPHTQ